MNKIEQMISFFTDASEYIDSIPVNDLVALLKEVQSLPEAVDYGTLAETIMETI